MKVGRQGVCLALDPVKSVGRSGRAMHRHCVLPAGHTGHHQSIDWRGEPVHRWAWVDDIDEYGRHAQAVADQEGFF